MKRILSICILLYYSSLLFVPGLLHWGHEVAHTLDWAFHHHEIKSLSHKVSDHAHWLHDLADQQEDEHAGLENFGFLFLLCVFLIEQFDLSFKIWPVRASHLTLYLQNWDEIPLSLISPPPQK
ncbi:MAG: hypothetical protein NW226_05685 [Microscillaceae bacterium]|nr:hypothetical protein [Microscillaceae bacterium]